MDPTGMTREEIRIALHKGRGLHPMPPDNLTIPWFPWTSIGPEPTDSEEGDEGIRAIKEGLPR